MNIGPAELLVIILFAFIIVGPERLPKAGRAIGNALRKLRDTQGEIDQTLKDEGLDPKSIQEASRNPFLALEKIEKVANAIPKDLDEPGDGETASSDEPASGPSAAEDAGNEAPAGVVELSDIETFTERKARIAAEASAKAEVDGEADGCA